MPVPLRVTAQFSKAVSARDFREETVAAVACYYAVADRHARLRRNVDARRVVLEAAVVKRCEATGEVNALAVVAGDGVLDE